MDRQSIRRVLLIASIALFVVSLFAEAIPRTKGLALLGMGWMEVFALSTVGVFVAFAWFANVLLLLTLFLDSIRNRFFSGAARILSCLGLGLCIGYIVFGQSIVTDESGAASTKVVWTTGYALWASAILAATLRAWIPWNVRE